MRYEMLWRQKSGASRMRKSKSNSGILRQASLKFRTGPLRRMRVARAAKHRDRSAARFVAVTGSSGKSTTVSLLGHILAAHAPVRTQAKDNTINPLIRTLMRHRKEERFVVAELGVGAKGKMPQMANMFRPDVAVVTMVGLEHYSAFRSHEGVAQEKGAMLDALNPDGVAVLNGDDNYVMGMSQRTSARIVTFGRQNTDVDFHVRDVRASFPNLLTFTIVGHAKTLNLKTQFPGAHFWMPVTAAVVAALELGVPIDIICAQVATFLPVDGRCSVLHSPTGPSFILDTAKAPNGTINLAIDMLADAKAPRKRIVLGAISDYKGNGIPKYRAAWLAGKAVADQVILVGRKISYARPAPQDVEDGRIIGFETTKEALDYIKETATPGELILLKGSANFHLERIALAFQQQVRCWEPACGMPGACFTCPGVARPFDRQAIKRARKWRNVAFWQSKKQK